MKRAVLLPLGSKSDAEIIKLRKDSTILGRTKGDVVVADSEVSSSHCQIQEIDSNFNIFDMNSTNGTFVNGKRIVKSLLQDGDTVTLGKTSFVFTFRDEKKIQNIATVFRSGSADKKPSGSVIETLIDTEMASLAKTKVILNVKYANGLEEVLPLDQRMAYIGRAASFGRFEEDSEMSRRHLFIKVNDLDEIFIEDQGSTNGTFVNGKRLTGMIQIQPEDLILVGETQIKISLTT